MGGNWIQGAVDSMKNRGTQGSFGKATGAKISAGIKAGGKQEKRAVLARTFKRMAKKRSLSRGR